MITLWAGSLLAVLGLIILAGRMVGGRLGLLRRSAAAGPELKLLSRLNVGPKQGVASVRFGDRVVLLSIGDGGVRFLCEEEHAVARTDEVLADEAVADEKPGLPETPSGRPTILSIGRSLRLLCLVLLVITGAASAVSAQTGSAGIDPTVQIPEMDQLLGALPDVSLQLGDGAGGEPLRLTGPVGTVLFVGFLTVIPTLLLLMTSFTRILIVLHLLKQAIGAQTVPPSHLLAAMALLLTGFVMAPTLNEANQRAVAPWMEGDIETGEMFHEAVVPFRRFMLENTREEDLSTFLVLRQAAPPTTLDDIPTIVLMSSFVTSELRAAFQIGFALFLPFLVIDLVVASVLMSMGMFMLPPVLVSLPFKLLLFVMVDGWPLVLGGVIRSFA